MSNPGAKWACDGCDLDFGSEAWPFLDHMLDAHKDAVISCSQCGFRADGAENFVAHVLDKHPETPSVPCPFCRFQGDAEQDTVQHISSEHPEDETSSTVQDSSSCPICGTEFRLENDLTEHLHLHFSENNEIPGESSGSGRKERNTDRQGSYGFLDQGRDALDVQYQRGQMDLPQYYQERHLLVQQERGIERPDWPLSGVIEKISELTKKETTYLCSECDFYASAPGDSGYGCGYRNIQMMLSTLQRQPDYRRAIWKDGPTHMPSIPKLQQLIEEAWRQGYDSVGRDQLGGRLHKTRKWIGTTEAAALLSYFRIRVRIIDFHRATGERGTHQELFAWVMNYFRERQHQRFRPPLYLQHAGHSRTIIGIQDTRLGPRILLFDPSNSRDRVENFFKESTNLRGLFRKTPNELRRGQFQVLQVQGVMEDPMQIEKSKTAVDLIRIP